MMLLPDSRIFHDVFARGESLEDFELRVKEAQQDESDELAKFRGEIAGLALDINKLLVPRFLSDFKKQIEIADYLAKQKIRISIPQYYILRVAAGPFDRWVVDKVLGEWGFQARVINTLIRKRVKYPSRECYVDFTFSKK